MKTNGEEPMNMATSESGYGLTKREYFAAMRKDPVCSNEDSLSPKWAEIIMGTPMPKQPSIESMIWWVEAT